VFKVHLIQNSFTLPTKHRKTQYTLSFTLLFYQPNTVKHNILFHLHFTLSTKHRKTQYIFSATVHYFHSHFTTYDLRRFATKQTGPECLKTKNQLILCFLYLYTEYA